MIPMQTPGELSDLQMLSFPWSEDGININGAICKTKDIKPGIRVTLIPGFICEDGAVEESRIQGTSGQVLQPKFPIGENCFGSICMDT